MNITKIVDKYFRPFVASAAAIFLIPWVLYLELVLRASKATGVPPELLARANTEEEALAIAAEALEWKAAGTPGRPQQTPAVYPSGTVDGVSQVSRETLKHLSAQQVNQLYAENRLAGIGAPAPEPRRTGEQHRHAAP